MRRPGRGPPAVPSRWADIIEEAAATADTYREDGYEVELLHPGDVVPIPDTVAFDILLPGSEFEAVEALAGEFDAPEVAVFTAQESGFGYAVIVATAPGTSTAICCPIYYELASIDELLEAIEDAIELHLRPLNRRSKVVIKIDEPDLLFGTLE